MFDPYHRWLAIPRDQRPPTYYQLLGIAPDETDAEVIQEAALRQTSHVRTYQTGPYAQQCQDLLTEISQAKVNLLNPQKRKAYDDRLAQADKGKGGTGPEAGLFPFDFAAQDRLPSPEIPRFHGRANSARSGLLALLYAALLLLGALGAFWLAFTRPEL